METIKLKRLGYLLYYVKEIDASRFRRFLEFAKARTGRSTFSILSDILDSTLRYNISILDYFYFRFFEIDHATRATFAGTGFMYEYQLKMNPKGTRKVLHDKIQFLNTYRDFVNRKFLVYRSPSPSNEVIQQMLNNLSGKIVLKSSLGQTGAQVMVADSKQLTPNKVRQLMRQNNFDLIEDYVIQHPKLMALSPSALNTVRVITQLKDGQVYILGARLRISVNSTVDNMAAGNMAAAIDVESGVVKGKAVFSDITKSPVEIHPVTGVSVAGFEIPYWKEILELTRRAAKLVPENKSIGWDVAITPDGVQLIEGNHNWCKLLWQLPVATGMKKELEKYL